MPLQIKYTGIVNRPITTIEKFAKRFVIQDDGCWQWIGYKAKTGYATFTINRVSRFAHRVMWELTGNPVDLTLQLDHLCRNRACVNPKHLQQVTAKVNVLRGGAVSAINRLKTHCPKGHEYTQANTYIHPHHNSRICRLCINIATLALYHRKKAAKALEAKLKEIKL